MKYLLFVFVLIFFFLSWCGHRTTEWNSILWDTWMYIINNTPTISTLPTWWHLPWFLSITWIKTIIIISWYAVTYKDLFSITIPKDLDTRSYENFSPKHPKNENLAFSEKTYARGFYIVLWDTDLLQRSITDENICLLQTDYNWAPNLSKKTTIKNIDGKNVFITQVTFFTEWNKNPWTYTTHFCFIDDSIMYDLVLDNYAFSYANHIIDSFSFF